jgi:hypothetical protein
MRYRIVIGDWSDDGHGKTETFIVDMANLSAKEMQANYDANVKKFGFDPKKVCEEYQDSEFPLEYIHALVTDGLKLWDNQDEEPFNFEDEYGPDIYGPELMARVLCYFVAGMDWKIVLDEMPNLFGGWSPVLGQGENYGYGMFY